MNPATISNPVVSAPAEWSTLEWSVTGIGVQTRAQVFALQTHLQAQTQGGEESHLAAIVGILALAFLAGGLVLRKRLAVGKEADSRDSSEGESMLTDRERVCSLIQRNGGRMKQSAIVDSVDWSKAKVSRLLADLEDEGEITKLRIGRENLVCIRGNEPTATRSHEPPRDPQ
ncbi:helix-turn-helix transcriptional regulator [Saliphagus sp. GCM10025334]